MNSGKSKGQWLALILGVILLGFTSWLVYDLLFDKPIIHKGTIVKMEFLPGKVQSGVYRMGSRARPQLISSKSHDRWIAVVRMQNGDTVLVECKKHHFENKEVGHDMEFKEFKGGTLEIKYFAHSEEQ